MSAASKELIGASTSLLILGVLKAAPSYGYDIVRRINQEADGIFAWREGTIYPLLHKLERQGLIRSRWQEADGSKRRKYYALTPAGHAALRSGADQWSLFNALVLRLVGENHA
jgi:PadR family transcriptional regulator PadR